MAGTVDAKGVVAALGRTALLKAAREFAGANLMERTYQQHLGDLQIKAAFEGMAKEVEALPEEEKLAEVLSRLLVVILMQADPKSRGFITWQLYTHLRSTSLLEAVKPNLGSIIGLDGKRIPPKEGA